MSIFSNLFSSFNISLNSLFTSYRRLRARKRPCIYIHDDRTFEFTNTKDSVDGIYTSPTQTRKNHLLNKKVRCLNNNKDFVLIHRDIIESLDFSDLFTEQPKGLHEQVLEDVAYDTYRRQYFNLTKDLDQPKVIYAMVIALLFGALLGGTFL